MHPVVDVVVRIVGRLSEEAIVVGVVRAVHTALPPSIKLAQPPTVVVVIPVAATASAVRPGRVIGALLLAAEREGWGCSKKRDQGQLSRTEPACWACDAEMESACVGGKGGRRQVLGAKLINVRRPRGECARGKGLGAGTSTHRQRAALHRRLRGAAARQLRRRQRGGGRREARDVVRDAVAAERVGAGAEARAAVVAARVVRRVAQRGGRLPTEARVGLRPAVRVAGGGARARHRRRRRGRRRRGRGHARWRGAREVDPRDGHVLEGLLRKRVLAVAVRGAPGLPATTKTHAHGAQRTGRGGQRVRIGGPGRGAAGRSAQAAPAHPLDGDRAPVVHLPEGRLAEHEGRGAVLQDNLEDPRLQERVLPDDVAAGGEGDDAEIVAVPVRVRSHVVH